MDTPNNHTGPYPPFNKGDHAPKNGLDTDMIKLRDHFAGLAMQGQAAKRGLERLPLSLVASCSYQMADAMIEARKEQS